MKAVILAGGRGSRLSEETTMRPKPMVDIGGRPLIWHIMKGFSRFGVNDFVVCCGYKGYQIKEYFAHYYLHTTNVTFDLEHNDVEVHDSAAEPWRVTVVDTGEETMTGGRLRRVRKFVQDEDAFFFTYGDGVADVDVDALFARHRQNNTVATVTAVRTPGRFGALRLDDQVVEEFLEKPEGDGGWINGGFFVLSPRAIDYVAGDDTIWEQAPVARLAAEGQLGVYRHTGIFCPVDTLRDKEHLLDLWTSGKLPWKI
jgi:glucose-1-phosphate cytidylyltransferase